MKDFKLSDVDTIHTLYSTENGFIELKDEDTGSIHRFRNHYGAVSNAMLSVTSKDSVWPLPKWTERSGSFTGRVKLPSSNGNYGFTLISNCETPTLDGDLEINGHWKVYGERHNTGYITLVYAGQDNWRNHIKFDEA